ncbi:hypothetical protein niasHT_023339 [Heterodera trifolii]|uniref:Uncharacterized protein n=1 Tax=Heterodera trifolii TaxID=157864 RepID=A0ABD2JDM8_9BILA
MELQVSSERIAVARTIPSDINRQNAESAMSTEMRNGMIRNKGRVFNVDHGTRSDDFQLRHPHQSTNYHLRHPRHNSKKENKRERTTSGCSSIFFSALSAASLGVVICPNYRPILQFRQHSAPRVTISLFLFRRLQLGSTCFKCRLNHRDIRAVPKLLISFRQC